MTIAVDGTPATTGANGPSGNTTVTLTTPTAGDLIVVVVAAATLKNGSYPTVASTVAVPTATGLTFTQRSATGGKQIGASGGGFDILTNLYVFTAPASAALSAVAITAVITVGNGTINQNSMIAFGLSGVNATAFDANGSLPAVANSTVAAAVPTVSGVSTTSANTMLLGIAVISHSAATGFPGTGYTQLASCGATSNGSTIDIQYQNVTATQSSVTVAFGTGENASNTVGYLMYADAIQALPVVVPFFIDTGLPPAFAIREMVGY